MPKPIMTQHDRERALFRYRNALLRADFDTVAKLLRLAERDAILWQMLNESHEQDDGLLESDATDASLSDIITYNFSSNGTSPKTHSQEDKIMNIAIPNPNRRMQPYPRMLSAIAAVLLLFVFGAILVTMITLPTGSNFGQVVELTQAPLKAGCQLTTTAAASDESLRLAQAADEVLDADEPDNELALLLSICALQTGYSHEADAALQRAMGITGSARSFLGYLGTGEFFSPDGRYMVTADNRGLLRLWDGETGAPVREITVPNVTALAFSPDGRYILHGGIDNPVRMLDIETGQEIRQFHHTHFVTTVAFSPDGHFILTVPEDSPDYEIHLWDAVTESEIRQLTGHTSNVLDAAFSPDGRYIASSSLDATIRLWDVATGDEIRQFPRHNPYAGHVAFSSDGQYLLNSGTYVVRLSDMESGETIREYTAEGSRVIRFPVFSPDRRYVLASDRDSIRAFLWDTDTGELLRIFDARFFDADSRWLDTVHFSRDGRFIAAGTANDKVWLWETDYRDTIADACQGVSLDFSPEEREQYGIRGGAPTCPQFAEGYALEPGMTPIPTQPIPVWTPLPTLESTGN
jgi:WD40 repeat protein